MKRRSAASLDRDLSIRRGKALKRSELEEPTHARTPAPGATSFPLKASDPEVDRLVAEFQGRRSR